MNAQRSDIVELLNQLGAPDDADALVAARALHSAVMEAGWRWEDLLVPDSDTVSSTNAESVSDADEDESAGETGTSDDVAGADMSEPNDIADAADGGADTPAANPDDDLRLVERLLQRKGLSEETQGDLKAFRDEIKAGRLTEMDSRYISALAKRLGV